MTWFLLILGVILLALGLWASQAKPTRREREVGAKAGHTVDEAWDIITQPLGREEELIVIPERRAWYQIDYRNRFVQGLLSGLGGGLLIAALVAGTMPRPEAAPPRDVAQEPAPEPAPAPVEPVPPPPEPPKPTNVTFSVELGDLPPGIAARLKEQGLIEDEGAFLRRLEERRVDVLLKAGTFIIPTQATIDQVIDALTA